ncbi:MAG: glyceraldehyde 3-phosphate dehydrogenase NAD-binding domain-containing protein, partial [Flavobacteriales bacterium]
MNKVNIGINGFGRIGRTVCRLMLDHPHLNIVAINDLADARTLAHLLKYDSIHGVSSKNIGHDENHILVNDDNIALLNHDHPNHIDWAS